MLVLIDGHSSPHILWQCLGLRDILCRPDLVACLVVYVPDTSFAIACMGRNVEAGFFVFLLLARRFFCLYFITYYLSFSNIFKPEEKT